MIYIFTNLMDFSEADITEITKTLPYERKIKAERYKFFKDRKLCILAYRLLMFSLKKEKIPINKFDCFYGEYGKPYIEGVHFNLSHCQRGLACVISNNECGVDVQDVMSASKSVELGVLSVAEREKVNNAEDKCEEFTRLWTRKEAYCKYLGCGLKSVDFLCNCLDEIGDKLILSSKRFLPDMWLSFCTEREEEIYEVTTEELINFDI